MKWRDRLNPIISCACVRPCVLQQPGLLFPSYARLSVPRPLKILLHVFVLRSAPGATMPFSRRKLVSRDAMQYEQRELAGRKAFGAIGCASMHAPRCVVYALRFVLV